MSDWPVVEIGSVADIFDGPHATPRTVDEGPIFLGIGALQDGRIDLSQTRHVTPEDFKTWTRRVKPEPGDVVFSYETRLGEAAIIPEGLECCLGRRMGLVRANRQKLDPRFFLYFYLSPPFQDYLRSRTIYGATVNRIALKEFPTFSILLPPMHQQRSISAMLGSLDDKIELNRRMNETLEAMAQTIFRDWFVDFGPTQRKIEGATDPMKIMGGLVADPDRARELADLFSASMDDGGLPEGWTQGRLDDVLELAYGKSLTKAERRPGPYPVYGSGGITGWHCESLVKGPSVVVGRKGTVGSLYWEDRDFYPIDTVFYVRSKAPLVYCYNLLQTLGLEGMNTDAAVPGLNRENAYRLAVPIVGPRILAAFAEIANPLRQKMSANEAERTTLVSTRDLLLPKLMSGEIRLDDARSLTAEAA